MAWAQGRHSVGYNAQAGELADLKDYAPWIAEAPHHCLQQTLRDLDRAFVNFFAGRASYPPRRPAGGVIHGSGARCQGPSGWSAQA